MLVGKIRTVIRDERHCVIALGREQRLFTGSARDAVLLQALWCLWTGCSITSRRCQADHLLEWARGGLTDPDNGGPNCGRHNRHRNRGFTVTRDDHGRWHTYRPDGTELGMP
jgi:hypothetical protein